jgi:hypothetical protein
VGQTTLRLPERLPRHPVCIRHSFINQAIRQRTNTMYAISIEDTVTVPVKFTMRERTVDKLFSFSLTAKRKTQDEIEEQPELSVKDFLLENISDWSGQRLVILENKEPAPFSKDAFEFMLKQPGLLGIVWGAYTKACGGKEKN